MATINSTVATLPVERLADAVRAVYGDHFARALDAGRATPFVLPYSLLGPFIVPTLWLAIPHVTVNPRLRHARWLVLAFAAWFDVGVILRTSSPNVAFGYAAGLMAHWGLISTMGMCLWYNPQLDAARIVKRPKAKGGLLASMNGRRAMAPQGERLPVANGNGNGIGNMDGIRQRKTGADSSVIPLDARAPEVAAMTAEEECEYVWEAFPVRAPFSERLNWALDMTTNFRFAGWNWSVPSIPHPDLKAPMDQPIDMSTMPYTTRSGYRRPRSLASFIRGRIVTIVVHYLILDFLSVSMMKDPYFIIGPDASPLRTAPLPAHLASLPPAALLAYRQLWSIAGVLSAITAVFKLNDLAQYYLAGRFLFPMRAELWQHSSTFGSFTQVLDRGLPGFWGGWWHQTFRAQFVAPARWLLDRGLVVRGSPVAALVMIVVSFTQSGLLHASGSISSVPATLPWRPLLFFLLQMVGVGLQTAVASAAKKQLSSLPKAVRRVGNLVFTAAWLHCTSTFFIDDLASAGIWLLEPVPVSLFRFLGYGHPGDHWYRWDRDYFPRWHSARHWWQSGFAI
ncbi:hypothetical protein N3K66_002406 [Trichothecium roseum]|uniref:Uncharacterized protein n=1 Tax=Trichothecium roseum TaxID=47278 RepID=A0ACC0V9J0_9HYPO|nr:hypothetical protein N3K66_002406 [Trichothecium roseum]